ncbi:MAG TPA: 50S ribosomal protein L19e [Thermoprotei archaeon]|nr:50S ribosomal protein L19e [Thermoprotei archaeon]
MSYRLVKRLAAEILGVGKTRIWIDMERLDKVSNVLSREDVRKLIKEGIIRKKPVNTPSRGRLRKRRGRRKGPGSRKGKIIDEKKLWMQKVRAQRRYLKMLRNKKIISRKSYRKLYALVKGNMFRSIRHLRSYIIEHGLSERI